MDKYTGESPQRIGFLNSIRLVYKRNALTEVQVYLKSYIIGKYACRFSLV